ncbi:hypothetical protein BXZ70DRAFT_349343 [Cristinia sonorae]|uniref:Uncharacterized protein n=1 Tax=Cristinia sonorae TaxID=1940300 RepID=A0A8K0XMT2_9AGAR|nr:hypothetical protein BXZ70DRAFT_349343 [Cristinia sonorae]
MSYKDNTENDAEFALRSHIRTLLLDYALTHLTTDYIAFTEDATNELLASSLQPIATSEPTDLVLQPALPEAICLGLHLNNLPAYEERWPIGQNASGILEACLKRKKGTCISSECWNESPNEYSWKIYRPASPVLTGRAIQETCILGRRSQPCPH